MTKLYITYKNVPLFLYTTSGSTQHSCRAHTSHNPVYHFFYVTKERLNIDRQDKSLDSMNFNLELFGKSLITYIVRRAYAFTTKKYIIEKFNVIISDRSYMSKNRKVQNRDSWRVCLQLVIKNNICPYELHTWDYIQLSINQSQNRRT